MAAPSQSDDRALLVIRPPEFLSSDTYKIRVLEFFDESDEKDVERALEKIDKQPNQDGYIQRLDDMRDPNDEKCCLILSGTHGNYGETVMQDPRQLELRFEREDQHTAGWWNSLGRSFRVEVFNVVRELNAPGSLKQKLEDTKPNFIVKAWCDSLIPGGVDEASDPINKILKEHVQDEDFRYREQLEEARSEALEPMEIDEAPVPNLSENQEAPVPNLSENQEAPVPNLSENQEAPVPNLSENQEAPVPNLSENQEAPVPNLSENQEVNNENLREDVCRMSIGE